MFITKESYVLFVMDNWSAAKLATRCHKGVKSLLKNPCILLVTEN